METHATPNLKMRWTFSMTHVTGIITGETNQSLHPHETRNCLMVERSGTQFLRAWLPPAGGIFLWYGCPDGFFLERPALQPWPGGEIFRPVGAEPSVQSAGGKP